MTELVDDPGKPELRDPRPPQKIDQTDFDVKQHDFLRQDIHDAEIEARAFERYVLLGAAALWAWTLKDAPQLGIATGVLSTLLGVLGGFRMWGLARLMAAKGEYVAGIERLLSRPALGGWENNFGSLVSRVDPLVTRDRRTIVSGLLTGPGMIGYSSAAMWLILIFASLPFGFVVSRRTPNSATPPSIQVQCATSAAKTTTSPATPP